MKSVKQRSLRRSAAQWHQIVEAQQASGLSSPRFCKDNGISYPSFINWKKKLNTVASKPDPTLPAFIELTPQVESTLPDAASPDAQPVHIELDLGAGIHLRISRGL